MIRVGGSQTRMGETLGSPTMRARRFSSFRRPAVAPGLALAASVAATLLSDGVRAQGPPVASPPAAAPVIPGVGTELIRVEAVVFDRLGRPVRGLGARDFRVIEDGVPQTLTHFQP